MNCQEVYVPIMYPFAVILTCILYPFPANLANWLASTFGQWKALTGDQRATGREMLGYSYLPFRHFQPYVQLPCLSCSHQIGLPSMNLASAGWPSSLALASLSLFVPLIW